MLPKYVVTHQRQVNIGLFVLGVILFIGACGVLQSHAQLFGQKRDTAVMVGTELPQLKSEVALLSASVEAERVFAEQAMAAREEQASVYILPSSTPVTRMVSVVQELVNSVSKESPMTVEKLTFDAPVDSGSFKTVKAHLTVRGSFQGLSRILAVLGFSGDMMVRDVLSVEVQESFLSQVEAAAPASLSRAEDFLYLDLIQYASTPDKAEQRVFADVPTDAISDIRATVLEGGLAHVRSAFTGIALQLRERNLWPLPLLKVDRVTRDGERWTVEMTAYRR